MWKLSAGKSRYMVMLFTNNNSELSEFHALLNSAIFNIHKCTASSTYSHQENKTIAMVAHSNSSTNDNKNEQF